MATQTDATVTFYLRKAKAIYAQAEAHLADGGLLSHMYVVHWVYGRLKRLEISASTWRVTKAALKKYLETLRDDPGANEALAELATLGNDGTRKVRSERSSGRKLKFFKPEDEYRFLEEWLPSRPTPNNIALREWMISSLNTGARPCEWEFATLIDGGKTLRLTNAKATNGRAHGKYRTVSLAHLPEDVVQVIRSHLDRVNLRMIEEGPFRQFQKAMENTVYYESRKCFRQRKRYPSLYTMRHQFSADAKASALNKEEVAALMGHSVDYTADQHYARRNLGHKIEGLRANPEEVARVRRSAVNPHDPRQRGRQDLQTGEGSQTS